MNTDDIKLKTIGVIGAGTMGNGIAQVFATSGFCVTLVDISQQALDRGVGRTVPSDMGIFVFQ